MHGTKVYSVLVAHKAVVVVFPVLVQGMVRLQPRAELMDGVAVGLVVWLELRETAMRCGYGEEGRRVPEGRVCHSLRRTTMA